MRDMKAKAESFIRAVIEESGNSATGVALAAGLSPGHLRNFLNIPDYTNLSLTTIGKIEEWCRREGLRCRFRDFLVDEE